jgi:hypothetical protein
MTDNEKLKKLFDRAHQIAVTFHSQIVSDDEIQLRKNQLYLKELVESKRIVNEMKINIKGGEHTWVYDISTDDYYKCSKCGVETISISDCIFPCTGRKK